MNVCLCVCVCVVVEVGGGSHIGGSVSFLCYPLGHRDEP